MVKKIGLDYSSALFPLHKIVSKFFFHVNFAQNKLNFFRIKLKIIAPHLLRKSYNFL